MVERVLAKHEVVGSKPITRSIQKIRASEGANIPIPMGEADRDKRNARLYILSLLSIGTLFAFGYLTVWKFLKIDVEGIVVSSRDVPSAGSPQYVTDYVIRSSNGESHSYLAGPTDASLPRSMPVGTQIKKEPWSLYYERNGQWHSFPFVFYSILLTASVCCLVYTAYVKLTS